MTRQMENVIAVFVLLALIGGAAAYLLQAKRNGVKCVGCPAGGSCCCKQKKRKKKLEGKVIAAAEKEGCSVDSIQNEIF